ncbi:hypothetical protein [Aeromonas cavernicola]|uniref:Uncharacterized protein n=1 Tax=Aeromonas cavernicola TaxID=1006623 RepID=A0A2H9U8G8_9GAMM|nr:hypothetical protein [Aeromonas cavernicola]PJG60269.1 hypothetical protein CUC53_02795 [Aeromonas cavernicola]
MPNQDLLFPILPRAPATPSSADFKREVNKISAKHRLRKMGTDNRDEQPRRQGQPPTQRDEPVAQTDEQALDPDRHIDLFI